LTGWPSGETLGQPASRTGKDALRGVFFISALHFCEPSREIFPRLTPPRIAARFSDFHESFGVADAILSIGAVTLVSGVVVAIAMREHR
jgi:hypothetical protein